jgi:acetyl esterase/lipase
MGFVAVVVLTGCLMPVARSQAQEPQRVQDVIYARKFGTALTLDVLKPAKPSGIGVLWMVSGGWFSSHDNINPGAMKAFLDHGQTVFCIVHGSAPKFTVPEILPDIDRATRFVRFHASEYGVDPNRLGISGGSAGGHLSLMQGTRGHNGDPNAKDPVDKVSSKIQAVACFFPPTDFSNYSEAGHSAYDYPRLSPFWATLGAKSDKPEDRAENAKFISPITWATKEMPPTLIMHGDKDDLVPIQQAQVMIKRLDELGVPAKLVVKEGAGHGWGDLAI